MKPYDPHKIEPKWQKRWDKEGLYRAADFSKKAKFYSLVEFPYPSGDGLHVGHPRPYIGMDVVSRKRRMQGYDVLYPIGWDAFGLPTENYAIKTGQDPRAVTKKNSETFERQIRSLGISFDWSREVNTTDPEYYKWTQWIFLQFLKAGLAYKEKTWINWCPKDLIGLANEEVVDGCCERCGTPVEKREKEQWMLAITEYADKLLQGLDAADYDMPKLVDKTNPHQPGKPVIKRSVAHAIVYDPRKKKYLIIRNEKFGWDTVIIGGIEGGERPEDTARREVREEAGYTDLEFKRILGGPTEAHYYTKHKGENRIAIATAVYFELKSDARVPINDEDDRKKGSHNQILWVDPADFVPGKMVNSELGIWLERLKDPSAGWPKPLLDWPESIKESQRNWIGKSEGAEFDFPLKGKPGKVLLIHGFEGSPTSDFHQWLKKNLEKSGYEVRVPALPDAYHPKFDEMMEVLKKEASDFGENDIILGHSMGGHLALKLAEGRKLKKLILVAPAIGGFGIPYEQWQEDNPESDMSALNKVLEANKPDFSKIDALEKVALFGIDDEDVPVSHADKLDSSWKVVRLEGAGHFSDEKYPEILEAVTPSIKVFTTRADTLFGVTYVVLAPEHELVGRLLASIQNKKEVEEYVAKTKKETDIVRTDAKREKTGVELEGVKAINPANGEAVPVWIADYVLADYGTGAVMAVPAHDERDFEFAKRYGLPVTQVIARYFEGPDEPREGIETLNRRIVDVIIENEKGEFLLIKEDVGVTHIHFVGGGTDGEDDLTALKREVIEETDYTDFEIRESIEPNISCYGFRHTKGKNQKTTGLAYHIKLKSEVKVHSEADQGRHSLMWVEKTKVKGLLTWPHHVFMWQQFLFPHAFAEEGALINSAGFDGLTSSEARPKITEKFGRPIVKYKLRDWVFSRQRYWGEPIPVVHCDRCGVVPVPEKDLPVELPRVKNYQPTQTGESPLAAITKWVNVKCPTCKGKAKRETDTMPSWAGSSWYYLRYADPKNAKKFADMKKLKYWTPVDWYNGGMEHTTLHLLYSRFWHKFLYDQGLVPTPEPYLKRTSHGLILAKGGEKMSKSRGNVVNPDTIVESVGADSLRLYEMFMGPFDQAIAWDENGIVGCRRFIERVWKLQEKVIQRGAGTLGGRGSLAGAKSAERERGASTLRRDPRAQGSDSEQNSTSLVHKTIKKVSEDIEAMRFNTAVSALMILLNELEKGDSVAEADFEALLKLLAPFAPHVADELWSGLGHEESIHAEPWPVFDAALLAESRLKIALQINGKTRGQMEVAADASDEAVTAAALGHDSVKKWLEGKKPLKIVVVKGRLVNIVVP